MAGTISPQKRSLVDIFRILVYAVAVFSFVVLALTGFYPVLIRGEHISGYLVMLHATFAPVFAVCLAVLAVMWANRCRFAPGDWPAFDRFVRRVTSAEGAEAPRKRPGLWQKITFWLVVFLALPLALSIILSMYHLVGTHWQELLLKVHRYTAYVFALAAVVHTALLARMQTRS
ncbi:MAG: cytochrome b/b6 domain-containing protein [Sedimentisphaerales bacterium]